MKQREVSESHETLGCCKEIISMEIEKIKNLRIKTDKNGKAINSKKYFVYKP